jgi:hypothetical protein
MKLSVLFNYTNPASSDPRKPEENNAKHWEMERFFKKPKYRNKIRYVWMCDWRPWLLWVLSLVSFCDNQPNAYTFRRLSAATRHLLPGLKRDVVTGNLEHAYR